MYISLITKEYLNGRVAVTTDRLGGFRTGHGTTPPTFWNNLLRWTGKRLTDESVRLGVIKSVETYFENYIDSLNNVTFKEITTEYIEHFGGSEFDVIYLIGLPTTFSSDMPDILERYVAGGGGLIFESPNIKGEIELLSSIDSIEVSSTSQPTYDFSSWTRSGVNSEIYASDFRSSFMVTINNGDIPNDWSILLSDVETSILPEDKETELLQYNYDRDAIQEFGISYVVGMKDGIVILEPGDDTTSSSNSSSSSSTLLETEWDFCDEVYAYWKLNEDNNNSFVWDSSGDFSQIGTFKGGGSNIFTSSKSSSGKVNNAIHFSQAEQNIVEVAAGTKLNFTDGVTDGPFSVSFWLYPLSLSGTQTIISKNNTWKVNLSSNKIQMVLIDGANTRSVETTSTIPNNKWSFLVCTYDGADIKIYLNTVNVSGSQSDAGYSAMANNSTALTIGADASTNWLDALLDNLLIINKVAHSFEIEGMWNRGDGTEDCVNIIAFTSSSDSSSSSIDSSSSSSSDSSSSSSSDSSSSSSSEGYSSSSSEGYSSSSSLGYSSSSSSEGYSSSSSLGYSSSSSSSTSEGISESSSQSEEYLCDVISSKNSYLSAYWSLEETSGDRSDAISSNTLTEQGISVGSGTGKKNNSVFFNNTHTTGFDDLEALDSLSLSPSSSVCFSTWIKVENQSGASNGGGLYGKAGSFSFTINNLAVSNQFFIQFSINQSDDTNVATSNIELSTGSFNNYVGIADGSNIYFYINNVLIESKPYDGTIKNSGYNFILSSINYPGATCDHYSDEIAIWKDIVFDNDFEREAFVEALWNKGNGMFWVDGTNNWDVCTEYASSESSESEGNFSSSSSSSG